MAEQEEEEKKTPFDEFRFSIYSIPDDVLSQEEKDTLIENGKLYYEFLDYMCDKYDITSQEAQKRYDKFASEFLQDHYEQIMVKSVKKFAEYNEYPNPDELAKAFWAMKSSLDKLNG